MYKRLHNPTMEYQLGLMHYRGKGRINQGAVEKNYTKALEHFRKADSYGSVDAKLVIGLMYYNGEGVEKDNKQAFEWVKKAAMLNDTDAQIFLAQMYRNGEGVIKDHKKAIELLRKAANAGDDIAQFDLGSMYLNGAAEGISRASGLQILSVKRNKENDKIEIRIFFNRSKEAGDVIRAEEWLRKSALKGNAAAEYMLGSIYYQGADAIEKDYAKAAEWLQEAILSGNTDTQVLLGIMHYNGEGVPVDNNQAMLLFNRANKKGNEDAKLILRILQEAAKDKRLSE